MDRKEKRRIRSQINNILDSECRGCEYNGKNQNRVCNKECPVGIKMQEISQVLFQDKKKQTSIFDTAFDLNDYTRRPWTIEEDYYLINHADLYSTLHLAQKFGRTPAAVQNRLNILRKQQMKSEVT